MTCMNEAQHAVEQLGAWPDLRRAVPACGCGVALRAADAEIVHIHGEHDADLHLTGAVIRRLHPELSRSTAIRLHPGSAWVTVHLDSGPGWMPQERTLSPCGLDDRVRQSGPWTVTRTAARAPGARSHVAAHR
ncbi:luciferase domain-containing protein [Streptomyces luteolifulvus]|uniref:luciferase domain-containing protein n=1 Tax=Streptomyces luteolifulvus TaxID=2615112 RepID=UPI0038B5390B